MIFSLTLFAPEYKELLKYLDVPVLQVIPMWTSYVVSLALNWAKLRKKKNG